MIIKIESSDMIDFLNGKFSERNKESFQKDINKMAGKIDLLNSQNMWKNYIENTYIECSSNYTGSDYVGNLSNFYFIDNYKLYFIYLILLEFSELKIISHVNLNVMKEHTASTKNYFDEILNIRKNPDKTRATKQLVYLDGVAEENGIREYIKVQGKMDSPSAVLAGIKKYTPFRVNTNKDKISYNIKTIKYNEVKEIICPVCNERHKLYLSNKKAIFKISNGKFAFVCKHMKNENFNKKEVSIKITEFNKEIKFRKIKELDFCIYNYQFLFKKFKKENDTL